MNSIESALEVLDRYVITGEEFNELISNMIQSSDGSIEAIHYTLEHFKSDTGRGHTFDYGLPGKGTATSMKSFQLENQLSLKISLWYRDNGINEENAEKIFREFWNSEDSNASSGLPSRDKKRFADKCNRTLSKLQNENKNIAVFMMDLDHFRDVNNKYNHDVGSAVIREFANVLLQVNRNKGIIIHQSGDEFNLLLSYNNPEEIVALAKEMRFAVKKHTFENVPDVALTMAMGIRIVNHEKIDFTGAVKASEGLYNPKIKNMPKQRDSVRIDKLENRVCRGEDSVKLAVCRIISNIFDKGILGNIYLEYFSALISEMAISDTFQEDINDVISWINPHWVEGIRCTKVGKSWDTKEEFSVKEIGLALMHGLLRNKNISGKQLKIDFGKNQNNNLSIFIGDKIIYQSDKKIEYDQFSYQMTIPKFNMNPLIIKRVVLVQAGYERENIPEDIFYNIIRVDNRPFIGGGLPDFWAAALCELITDMNCNENFTDIVIYGDTDNTRKIEQYLKNINKWGKNGLEYGFDYISKKTYKSNQDIIKFKEKFTGHVCHVKTKDELIDHIYNIYNDNKMNWDAEIIEKPFSSRRFLDRQLAYNDIRLDLYDGCKAKSISDAFPIVLEILRNSNRTKENSIIDQAGRELLELTNFKITLSTPKSNDLPDYYSFDIAELEKYYNATFAYDESLFRKRMLIDNQFDVMLQHVVSAISNKEKRYATRRAVLVVPNKVENESNYSPLGLVSIWLAPRFISDKVVIDFSYTWRTVEALVGLPLSMYASVKFAEEITESISKKVFDEGENCIIKLGQVSYIAHSLHMFLDTESVNIVRGIVNEASF
ncbi:MAG TPA: diguanylate cyclase [Clostridiales bacterium]|nr:diguanylate cyclase [Clostridiales bacterium]